MEICFIRHGATRGNEERRYVGARTDEGLSSAGKDGLLAVKAAGRYPSCGRIWSGPMKRCVETATLIYEKQPFIAEGLTEMDFGDYEGKRAEDLYGLAPYEAYLASGGKTPFPGGEDMEAFRERTLAAFDRLTRRWQADACADGPLALVCHGGTIMALFSARCTEKKAYFSWHVAPGRGYKALLRDDGSLQLTGEI